MKNNKAEKFFLLFITAILMSLTLSFSVNAASGCCAGHGGVKCSAGPDSDGSVICNDGWRDSSCSYSGMEKCKIPTNDSTSSNSNNSTNSNSRASTNTTKTVTSQNRSFMSRHPILGFLIAVCAIFPFLPIGLVGLLLDRLPGRKNKASQINNRYSQSEIKKAYDSQYDIRCPLCGSTMVKRHSRYGYFYGCSKYPRCNGTRNIRYKS